MDSIFFVMAILGCGDGSAGCVEARVEPTQYRSAAECRANLPVTLARHTDLSYPVISANCRRQGVQVARNDARPRG